MLRKAVFALRAAVRVRDRDRPPPGPDDDFQGLSPARQELIEAEAAEMPGAAGAARHEHSGKRTT